MLTFSVNKTLDEVANATRIVTENPVYTDLGRQWKSEAFMKALDNPIYSEVDVDSFGMICEHKTKLAQSHKGELSISFSVEESKYNPKSVSIDHIEPTQDMTSYIDEMIDKYDVEEASIKKFHEYEEFLLVEEGVNITKVIQLALTGEKKHAMRLKNLMWKYSFNELLETILTSDKLIRRLNLRRYMEQKDDLSYEHCL